jgi:hypothetical protein
MERANVILFVCLTFALMMVSSAKCKTFTSPSSLMATILEEYLMVPFGSSFTSVSRRKFRFTHRISCGPLMIVP